MRNLFLKISHLLCLAVILLLAGFIVRENTRQDYYTLYTAGLPAFKKSSEVLDSLNVAALDDIRINTIVYPSPLNDTIYEKAQKVAHLSDSIISFINAVSYESSHQGMRLIMDKLDLYQNETADARLKMYNQYRMLYEFEKIQEVFLKEKSLFSTIISNKIRLMESAMLTEYRSLSSYFGIYCGERFRPEASFTEIPASVHEMVNVDVFFTSTPDPTLKENTIDYLLDGEKLTPKDGVASFRKRFDKPGRYPLRATLQIKDLLTDSIHIFEKTYFVKVKE